MKFNIEHELLSAQTNDGGIAKQILFMTESHADVSKMKTSDHISHVGKMLSTEIPDAQYLTITANDITIGGKSTTEYNGNKMWNRGDFYRWTGICRNTGRLCHGAR